ncbi:MAG: 50S ribosomal protein L21 [Chloroflexi bacterium]|nr:50S ribosomal protein L21 [Chloroflexota bacterium]
MEYAVIETGGKQYTVHPGDTIQVERFDAPEGGPVELDRVLMVARDGDYSVGRPVVEGARVKAEVLGEGKAPKVVVFKFKNKVRYRRKRGHRQPYTQLRITEIVAAEKTPGDAPRIGTSRTASDGS